MKKYPSLENHYRQSAIDDALHISKDALWSATEKIHGVNFRIAISKDGEITYGTRNQILSPEDSFHDYLNVVSPLLGRLLNVFPGKSRIFYGEIFGEGVQKGVFYSKEKRFLIFDLYLVDEQEWVSQEELFKLDLPLVPLLSIGPLSQLLTEPNNFDSVIPAIYGEEAPANRKTAEGLVLKPFREILHWKNGDRMIIKSKDAKFSEVNHQPKEKAPLSPVANYLTQERVNAVLSKEANLCKERIGEFVMMVLNDAVADAIKDGVISEPLTKEERKALTKKIPPLILSRL